MTPRSTLVPLAVLTAATCLWFEAFGDSQYRAAAPAALEWTAGLAVPEPTDGWLAHHAEESATGVVLEIPAPGASAVEPESAAPEPGSATTAAWLLHPVRVEPGARYRLRARFATSGIEGRYAVLRGARLVYFSLGERRVTPLLRRHRGVEVCGSHPSTLYSEVTTLREDVSLLLVGVDLHADSGRATVESVVVERVSLRTVAVVVQAALGLGWIAFLVRWMRRLWARNSVRGARVGLLGAALLILLGTTASSNGIDRIWEKLGSSRTLDFGFSPAQVQVDPAPAPELARFVAGFETSFPARTILQWRNLLRKIGHFVLFGAFAAFAAAGCAGFPRTAATWSGVLGPAVVLAVSTECLQYFAPGRSPHTYDVLLDLCGATAGLYAVHRTSRKLETS